MPNKWFVIPKPNPLADIRLICFPYAGGGPSIYSPWLHSLPNCIELVIMQAPGRSNRIIETPIDNMNILIEGILSEIPKLINKPYVLFGHSLGSKVGFELIRRLTDYKLRLPIHFIVSGSSGPQKGREQITYSLTEDEFINKLRNMNGTPQVLLNNAELMKLLLPMLRADFEIAESYRYSGCIVFDIPLSVFGGEDDSDVTDEDLLLWQKFFESKAKIRKFPGDHFFIDSHRELVIAEVNKLISSYTNTSTSC